MIYVPHALMPYFLAILGLVALASWFERRQDRRRQREWKERYEKDRDK